MGEVRKISVAGDTFLAVATHTGDGWRATGYFKLRPVVVESLETEDEAFNAWKLKALDSLHAIEPGGSCLSWRHGQGHLARVPRESNAARANAMSLSARNPCR